MKKAMTVLSAPSWAWVSGLKSGNWIWLPKEKEYAQVSIRWQRPEPGHCAGDLTIARFNGDYFRGHEIWFVRPDGTGLDHNPLILPVEGHMPREPLPDDNDDIEDLKYDVKDLRRKLLKLEVRQRRLENIFRQLGIPGL